MSIETTIRIWQEGETFVAHAMPLDMASCGKTAEEARAALREAVDLFVKTARERGTLDEILEECGYTLHDGKWVAPKIVVQQQDLVLT